MSLAMIVDVVNLESQAFEAIVDWELDGEHKRVDVWAPEGMYWNCSGTHCLCSMVNKPDLKDLVERIRDGVSNCCDGGCNRDCEWAMKAD